MKSIPSIALLAASALAIPSAAVAQRAPAAVIVVVDGDRIGRECTACRSALTQMQAQETTLRNRAQTLQRQLQSERQPIQTAVSALGGKQPDAALQQRITAYETKDRNAQQELATGQRNLQSTQVHVTQQISSRLTPIIAAVAQARGANIAVDKGATLFAGPAVDVTAEVLARLNQQVPSVRVTPLPQQQQQQQPGR